MLFDISKSVDIPIYNFSTHSREAKTKTVYGANVVIFEGIFALYDKRITDLMDLKVCWCCKGNGSITAS